MNVPDHQPCPVCRQDIADLEIREPAIIDLLGNWTYHCPRCGAKIKELRRQCRLVACKDEDEE